MSASDDAQYHETWNTFGPIGQDQRSRSQATITVTDPNVSPERLRALVEHVIAELAKERAG